MALVRSFAVQRTMSASSCVSLRLTAARPTSASSARGQRRAVVPTSVVVSASVRHSCRDGNNPRSIRHTLARHTTAAREARQRRAVIAAAGGGDGDGDEKKVGDDETTMSGLARRLVERKYNPEAAKAVLETFDKLGIENEEQLQQFFAQVSLPQLGGQVGQIVIVGLSAWVRIVIV